MSERANTRPAYVDRGKPPSWDGLVEDAARISAQEDPEEAVAKVLDLVEKLDDLALDSNRYFGLRVAAGGLAEQLKDPKTRDDVIESNADIMVAQYWERHRCTPELHRPRLMLGDVQMSQNDRKVDALASNSIARLSQPERLLVDTMIASCNQRISDMPYNKDAIVQSIVEHELARKTLVRTTFMGAGIVTRLALRNLYSHRTNIPRDKILTSATEVFGHITTYEELPTLNLLRLGASAARLRNDELTRLKTYTSVDDSGMTYLDRAKVPKEPPPLSELGAGRQMLRKKRLKCPALFVPGLIEAAVTMTPDILIQTDQKIRSA